MKKKNISFDKNTNLKFNSVRSKFLGYNLNKEEINKLKDPFKIYANLIIKAKSGNLKESLSDLNYLISANKNNLFLIETKADILFSYGYIDESIKFYKKVYNKYPNNYYAQIRIFENTNFDDLSINEQNDLFFKNLNLLNKFYNNKNILLTYYNLSNKINKVEWINFINYWVNKKIDKDIIINNLNNFKKTNDKHLLNLIELIYNDIK